MGASLDPMLQHLRDKTQSAWKEEKEWEDGLSRGGPKPAVLVEVTGGMAIRLRRYRQVL